MDSPREYPGIDPFYDLPETFPRILQLLRSSKNESQATIIQELFHTEEGDPGEIVNIFEEKVLKYRPKDLNELVLDFDYVLKQIKDFIWHLNREYPGLYHISVSRNSNSALKLKRRLTYQDLLQFLVDNDYSINFNTKDSFWSAELLKPSLIERLAEQDTAIIDRFLREGDIVFLDQGKGEPREYYFVYKVIGDDKWLSLLPAQQFIGKVERAHYLPMEAIPFLKDHDLNQIDKVNSFLKLSGKDWIYGISDGSKFYKFPSVNTKPDNMVTINGYSLVEK